MSAEQTGQKKALTIQTSEIARVVHDTLVGLLLLGPVAFLLLITFDTAREQSEIVILGLLLVSFIVSLNQLRN